MRKYAATELLQYVQSQKQTNKTRESITQPLISGSSTVVLRLLNSQTEKGLTEMNPLNTGKNGACENTSMTVTFGTNVPIQHRLCRL